MTAEPKGLLLDPRRCTGCRRCTAACARSHGLPASAAQAEALSARALTALRKGDAGWIRNQCRHCLEPACASACIVGALRKSPSGPVSYDADKCIGCRYCMLACPFNVPRYEWDSPTPKMRKCDLCVDRVEAGKPTACAEACPSGATVFGPRAALLEEARARIAREPRAYLDRVFGEKEVGGTSVLYLLPRPAVELGFKAELGEIPLPALTGAALARVPGIAIVGGATLAALWWVLRRRDEVAAAEAAAAQAARARIRSGGGPEEGRP